jgi:hypothetical protein
MHVTIATESWFCRQCQIDYPDEKDIRKKTKLAPQHEEVEPQITSIQSNMADQVEIRHTPPIRGGFAELQNKGLKIKDYHTTERQ